MFKLITTYKQPDKLKQFYQISLQNSLISVYNNKKSLSTLKSTYLQLKVSKNLYPIDSISMQNSFANGTDQPFYLSIRVEKIFFTPQCRLNGLVQKMKNKMKESGKSQTSENQRTNDLSLMKKQISRKIQFQIQMYHVSQESPQQQLEKKVAETTSFGKLQDVELTRKLYIVPQGLTQLRITSKNQLTLLIKNFSPQKRNQIKLSIYFQEDKENKILGQITIDANIFILLFLEDNIECTTSSEMLCHKSETNTEIHKNDEKGNSHHAQVVFEIFVQRDRLNLERVMREKKKCIQVVEFRQNIRNILRSKEKSLKTQNLNSNIAESKSESDQTAQKQIQTKKNIIRTQDEQFSKQSKQTKISKTKQLYQKYLKSSVQPQLFYQNSSSIYWQERDKIHHLSKINQISSDQSGFKTIKYQEKSQSIVDSEQNDSYESIRKTKSFILEQSNKNQTEYQVQEIIREKHEFGQEQRKSEKKMNKLFQPQKELIDTKQSTQKRKQNQKYWIGEMKIVGILLLAIIMIALFFQSQKNTNTSDQYDENEDLNWN